MIKLPDLRRVFGCSFRCNRQHTVELSNRSYNGKSGKKTSKAGSLIEVQYKKALAVRYYDNEPNRFQTNTNNRMPA